ncbi:MAG: glycosyltransferase family 4 protein [Verrucomicrobiaceae bacterium]|nr:glycosyltransferase family 4 protein [Verrucomicrobiaceae bacterium]
MNNELQILFAPVLRSEGWISIDLQQQNILEALRAHAPEVSITILQPPEHGSRLPLVRPLLRDMLYPRLIRARSATLPRGTLLHIADHSYGHLCAAHSPCVINCNDLHHHVRPELPPRSLARWKKRIGTMRHAAKIITVSKHLSEEVRHYLQLPAHQVAALPGAVDHDVFRSTTIESATHFLPALAALRSDHLLVLNIGSNIERKNLPTVVRALHLLKTEHHLPVKLVKVGPPLLQSETRALIDSLGMQQDVIDLGVLTPPQVAAACTLCHALSFASFYEGFGRPTLEAQACELPCVLSDASCMREVGADGALYHVPADHEQLAVLLEQAMTDQTTRSRLIAAGLRNAAAYTWKNYALSLLGIYRDAAASA